MEKIGVIAGGFDPIHEGHVDFIKDSIIKYSLDKVFILIEKKSLHKKIFAPYEDRKKMVQLAISDDKKISIYETDFDNFPISNCLPKIKSQYPKSKIHLLIGSDVAEHIHNWEGSDELLEGVELIISQRQQGQEKRFFKSGEARAKVNEPGRPAELSDKVFKYIKNNKLYL